MIEFRARTVTDVVCNGAIVDLTPQERTVLDALVAAGGEFVPCSRIVAALGGGRKSKHIHVLVCRLREKLGHWHAIESVRGRIGTGWRWAL